MKDKLMFSPQGTRQDPRHDATRGMGFPSMQRPAIGKATAKGTGVHAQHCDSAFLAERGCFGRAISPKHTVPAPHHA
jgi:hypothetical protein